MGKSILYCADGTWNGPPANPELETDIDAADSADTLLGAVTHVYKVFTGDSIHIAGFSRGAYTARALADFHKPWESPPFKVDPTPRVPLPDDALSATVPEKWEACPDHQACWPVGFADLKLV